MNPSMWSLQWTGLPMEQLGALFFFAAVMITLLYLLKLKKRRVQVPFSPLWGRVLAEYRQQTDWWRRLRHFLSWLLFLLMASLLVFALGDPHPEGEVLEGRHIVVLVDSSASMASTDVSGGVNRLDVAKQRAREIFETVGAEDRIMLVNFHEQLQPLSPFVAEPSVLEQPLRDLKVVATGTDYGQALQFAADSLRDKKRGELVILSDGAGFDPKVMEGMDFGAGTTLRHIKVGESAGNLGVTGFSVRRYLSNKLDYELFVRVQSSFERPVEADLELWADGRLVDSRALSLEAGASEQRFFPAQAVSGERLEARVRMKTADARDVFPLDDRAYALLPPTKKLSVLLVTPGNLYLEGTLLLNANVTVEQVTAAKYDPSKSYDVVFIDRDIPEKLPASGFFVYVDPQGERSPWPNRGYIKNPIITSYKKSHPLMRWIGMRDVNIGQAQRFGLGRGDEVVASAFGDAMIVSRVEGERKLVGLAFDLRASDLPLRVAFPVLMLNILDYSQLDDEGLVQNGLTGRTLAVKVEEKGAKEAVVVSPDGQSRVVPVYGQAAMVYADQAGFYEISAGGAKQALAANLINPREAEIAPQQIVAQGQEIRQDTGGLFFKRDDLWIWALLACLALLLLEWYTYNRRITI
jgi:hypothetical protein